MLRYLGLGERQFGDFPLPPHARMNWEFLAVVSGRIAPLLATGRQPRLAANTLWLFPPGMIHGWRGEPGRRSEIVVLHFNTVPVVLEQAVELHGFLAVKLKPQDRRRLQSAGRELKRHYWRPIMASELHTERVLIDLGLLLLRGVKESRKPQQTGGSLEKVLRAEAWLRRRLADQPTIAGAAHAAGLSESQLRRMFLRVRKVKPHRVLDRLRIEKAMRLMADTQAKLQHVATECGLTSAASLCRLFRKNVGKTPNDWRREVYIQYRRPNEKTAMDYTQHGQRMREL